MQAFADKVVENINVDEDYVWVHDYHLLALPSLLRKARCRRCAPTAGRRRPALPTLACAPSCCRTRWQPCTARTTHCTLLPGHACRRSAASICDISTGTQPQLGCAAAVSALRCARCVRASLCEIRGPKANIHPLQVVAHVRLGLFLHSPFPSSEVFRTFPRREELLRSLLNADLIGVCLLCLLCMPPVLAEAPPTQGDPGLPAQCGPAPPCPRMLCTLPLRQQGFAWPCTLSPLCRDGGAGTKGAAIRPSHSMSHQRVHGPVCCAAGSGRSACDDPAGFMAGLAGSLNSRLHCTALPRQQPARGSACVVLPLQLCCPGARIFSAQRAADCTAAVAHAGFHTFDYARHFLSCCSRMLGLEHVTHRGSIMLEYYGRSVGIKILPTGVKPERLLDALRWQDTLWRRGELLEQACRLCPGVPAPSL